MKQPANDKYDIFISTDSTNFNFVNTYLTYLCYLFDNVTGLLVGSL